MTSSAHASCSCHHHHRCHAQHKKQHAHKDTKHAKEEAVKVTVPPKPTEGKAGPQKPVEKPWSPWIVGDSGRFYYRGRQKPGGDWEYQFLEAYSAPVRTDQPYTSSTVAYGKASTSEEAGTSATNAPGYPVKQGGEAAGLLKRADATGEQSDVKATSDNKQKSKAPEYSHKGKDVKLPGKKGKKPAHPKKISTVIIADKRKKLNPHARIRGWLDEFEPSYER